MADFPRYPGLAGKKFSQIWKELIADLSPEALKEVEESAVGLAAERLLAVEEYFARRANLKGVGKKKIDI